MPFLATGNVAPFPFLRGVCSDRPSWVGVTGCVLGAEVNYMQLIFFEMEGEKSLHAAGYGTK